MNVLTQIRGPRDVKALDPAQLHVLAAEIRELLISAVAKNGGHLGPNLGVVELTIALHRVFESPHDRLLFDVGHQAYVHKILTGRQNEFDNLRQRGGLSGYPNQAESEHDIIENSHASTALSYADGLAKAYQLRGDSSRAIVVVVGDGALTGGMCWEALNNIAATKDRPVVIVINDNGRSYAPTVGGLAAHLMTLRDNAPGTAFDHTPSDQTDQPAFQPQTLFADLGLQYYGPVDGHDIAKLEIALRRAHDSHAPAIVHCVTRKGAGFRPAEEDEADCLHGVGVMDPQTGIAISDGRATYTSVFSTEMVVLGAENPDLVAVTAAMLRPVGLHPFAQAYPTRVFDVGIAEQHAVTSAAGLALGGMHPVVCLYATFLNRAFDQMLLDVALHGLPVTFVISRAGITGVDGPSHNGMWDLSLFGVVPGLAIAAPRDGATLRTELREAVAIPGPSGVRYPHIPVPEDIPALQRIGRMDVLARGARNDILIVSIGALATLALRAAADIARRGFGVTVVDPRWVQPVDPALITLAATHTVVVTVEDNGRSGGVGDAIARALRDADVDTPVRTFGIEQAFPAHGRRDEVLGDFGLTEQALDHWVTAAIDRCTAHRLTDRVTAGSRRAAGSITQLR